MSHDQYGNPTPHDPYRQHEPYAQHDPYAQGDATRRGPGGSTAYGRDHDANSWGEPVGQRSAGYTDEAVLGHPHAPQAQPSASYPQSQASAPYPQSQASAPYPQSQPSAAYAGQPAHPGQSTQWQPQPAGQQPPPQAPRVAGSDDSFFPALVDFGFTRYATPMLVKVCYVLGIILGALSWIGGAVVVGLTTDSATSYSSSDSGAGVLVGVLWFLFGAPVFLFFVITLRVQLELMLAMIRTNQDTKAIRARLEG